MRQLLRFLKNMQGGDNAQVNWTLEDLEGSRTFNKLVSGSTFNSGCERECARWFDRLTSLRNMIIMFLASDQAIRTSLSVLHSSVPVLASAPSNSRLLLATSRVLEPMTAHASILRQSSYLVLQLCPSKTWMVMAFLA